MTHPYGQDPVKRPSKVVVEHNSKKLSEIILRCRNVHLQEKTNDHRVHQAILLLVAAQKHLKHQRLRALKRGYYLRHKSLISVKCHQKHVQLRLKVLSHYSPTLSCQQCGIKDLRVLSIDHINSHGAKHRKRSFGLYSWLRRHRYPPGYQVLCMNCQQIKVRHNHEYLNGNYMPLNPPPITLLENSLPTSEQVAYEREHGNKYEDFEYNWHRAQEEQRRTD